MNFRKIIFLSLIALAASGCHSHDASSDHHSEEEENHEGHGIELPEATAREFGVEYETITPSGFQNVIKTTGVITPSPSDIHTLPAKQSGIVSLLSGIHEGANVKAGQKIGTVTSSGIQGGDINQAASANLRAAQTEYERLKSLFEQGLVTASTFREAERAYNEAKALAGADSGKGVYAIISPADGTIQSLMVNSGQYVEVGAPVAVVSKNSSLTLKADLPASKSRHYAEIESANFLPEGATEVMKLSDVNGKKVSGNTISSGNGFLPVYFTFSGNPLSFPGGYAEVYLLGREREGVISVPREALVEIQGNNYAYVLEDEHGYEKRLVVTGASDGERIEIISGLEAGEKVVSKGASIIRMAEVSSVAPPAHTHNH